MQFEGRLVIDCGVRMTRLLHPICESAIGAVLNSTEEGIETLGI